MDQLTLRRVTSVQHGGWGEGGEFPRQVWAPSIFPHTSLWSSSSVPSFFIHTSVLKSLGSALHRWWEINAWKRVLNPHTGWSVTPRPLYTRCKSPCYRVVPQGWLDTWQDNTQLSAVRTHSVHWSTSPAELLESQPGGTGHVLTVVTTLCCCTAQTVRLRQRGSFVSVRVNDVIQFMWQPAKYT